MHDRRRAGRTSWPKLFTENPRITRRNRRMIETSGVDRDLIPTMKGVEAFLGRQQYRAGVTGLETLPECILMISERLARGRKRTYNGEQACNLRVIADRERCSQMRRHLGTKMRFVRYSDTRGRSPVSH